VSTSPLPLSSALQAQAPIDPAVLAQMASTLFATPPGGLGSTPPGVQAPVNIAPPGSPLVSPAGFGPSMPGTPIPQGLVPGANLDSARIVLDRTGQDRKAVQDLLRFYLGDTAATL